MTYMKHLHLGTKSAIALAVIGLFSQSTLAATKAEAKAPLVKAIAKEDVEKIAVVGRSISYANNDTSDEMKKQQSGMTTPLATIGSLPGVLVNEGDTFGSDDWSTSISVRGFQVNLGEQQIGITVDGFANGNSNYGGGAKANRYIDSENLGRVEVSQGTADIASRSNEALGGTLNFTTIDPGEEEAMVVSTTLGEFNAQKFFVRYETGEFAPDTYAWISASNSSNTDWMTQSAQNTRDHYAAKIKSMAIDDVTLTAYFSYDDTHEDNYQRIYSVEQFKQNPIWDQLTDEWSGVPYQDQAYRRGWSTLRTNIFAYLQADVEFNDEISGSFNIYHHNNDGRGDWVPPYLVDVKDDGAGNPHSELVSGNTVYGGSSNGKLYFVDSNGESVSPLAGCESAIGFPYGGAGAEYDPGCHEQGARPVGSYRHTHYDKTRTGINGDIEWNTQFDGLENTLRAGFWFEDFQRDEHRDWHKIIDSATSYRFDHVPYWVQYDREFPVDTLMMYIEDTLNFEVATVRLGAKQFDVTVKKNDQFDDSKSLSTSSDSDVLLSAGIVVPFPEQNLELFAGYAENFAAIKDAVLERDDADISIVKPETADNIDLGLRYLGDNLQASITYYSIKFDNRIRFVSNESSSGIDFLESSAGGYLNEGGIESKGIEASATYQMSEHWSVYLSYTNNDSTYTDEDNTVNGNTVAGSAEDMFVVSLDWQKDNFFAGLSTKQVGDRWMNRDNSQRVESYVVSDLYVGTQITDLGNGIESIDLRLTANNLFDESYLGTIAENAAWIGAPRTIALNASIRF